MEDIGKWEIEFADREIESAKTECRILLHRSN